MRALLERAGAWFADFRLYIRRSRAYAELHALYKERDAYSDVIQTAQADLASLHREIKIAEARLRDILLQR